MNITKSPSLQLLRKLHYQFSGLNDVSISSEDDWDSVTTVVHRNSGWYSARTSRCSSIMSLTLDWEENKRERELSLRNALKCETLEEPNYKFGLNVFLASDGQGKESAPSEPRLKSPVSQLGSPLSPSLDYRVSVGALLSAECKKMEAGLKPELITMNHPKAFDLMRDTNLKSGESSSRASTTSPFLEEPKLESPVCELAGSSWLGESETSSPVAEHSRSPRLPVCEQIRSPRYLENRLSESDASEDVSSSAASAVADANKQTSHDSDERPQPSAQELKNASKRIFVSNLSDHTTKNTLFKFFGKFAKVSNVYLVKDYKTRKSRGRAFVQFATADDVKRVLATDPEEFIINGRTLHVDAARPRQPKMYQVPVSTSSMFGRKPQSPTPPPSLASLPVAGSFTINNLPCELMQLIFSYLTVRERIAAERVCKYWRYVGVEANWNIKNLTLEGMFSFCRPLSDDILRQILKRCGSSLVYLNMNNCGQPLSYRSVEMLPKYCPNLEILNLANMPVTNTGLKILAATCVKIRKLTLKKCNFGEKGLWWLLKNCNDLEYLDVSENDRINGLCFHIINPRVKSLNLNKCVKLTPKGLFELKRCTGIEHIILSDCTKLDTAALQFILNDFASTLKTLHLDGRFTRVDFHDISCRPMPNIVNLSFTDNENVDDLVLELVAKNCRNVRKLDLSGTFVTNFGLQHLLECPHLCELNISHLKEVTSVGIEMLAMAGRLERLIIRGSENLTNNACVDLVTHCKQLAHLDISNCTQVTDEAVVEWMNVIDIQERNAQLEVVAGGTEITNFIATPALTITSSNLCPSHLRPYGSDFNVGFSGDEFEVGDNVYDDLDPRDDIGDDEFEERLAAYEMKS